MSYIPTESVESSNLVAIGYHRQTQTLRIIFQEGRAYDYPLVPESEFKGLMEAESKGKFFNSRIKPMYGHRTVRPEQLEPPPEPCCDHPDKSCSDEECGECDPGCCPQKMGRTGAALSRGVERGKRLLDEAASGVPPALPLTAEGEVDYKAIPDATSVIRAAEQQSETGIGRLEMGAHTGGPAAMPILPLPDERPMTKKEWEDRYIRGLRQAKRIANRLPAQYNLELFIADVRLLVQLLDELERQVFTLPPPIEEDKDGTQD